MPALLFEYPVYLAQISDSLPEKYEIHMQVFRIIIVVDKFSFQTGLQLVMAFDHVIDLAPVSSQVFSDEQWVQMHDSLRC